MTAPEVFEAPIEEDRFIPIENSHLLRGRCSCGATALSAPGQEFRCGMCRRADADAGTGRASLADRGLFRALGQGHPPAPPAEREPFPAPEVTSRDAWGGEGAPSAFRKLAQRARNAGWAVREQRSTGCFPNAATGRPGGMKDVFALVLHKGTANAYAVYAGDAWTSVMLWGAEQTWFPLGSVTDLGEYLLADGRMPESWYEAIRRRDVDAEMRRKEREACNKGTHALKYRTQAGSVMSCSRCGNSWPASGEPWKKPKVRKTEAN